MCVWKTTMAQSPDPINPGFIALVVGATRRAVLAYDRWRTERSLMACNDRTLANIGIRRDGIGDVVRSMYPAETPGAAAPSPVLRRVAEERRVYGELMGYTDRELADINIRRGDIAGIARDAGRMAA